jgi:hypothetical protein
MANEFRESAIDYQEAGPLGHHHTDKAARDAA